MNLFNKKTKKKEETIKVPPSETRRMYEERKNNENKIYQFLFENGYKREVVHGHGSYERYILGDYCLMIGDLFNVYEAKKVLKDNPFNGYRLDIKFKGTFESVEEAHTYITGQ